MNHLSRWAAAFALICSLLGLALQALADSPFLTPVVKDATGKLVGPVVSLFLGYGNVLTRAQPTQPLLSLTLGTLYDPVTYTAGFYVGSGPVIGWTAKDTSEHCDKPYMNLRYLPVAAAIPFFGRYSSTFYYPVPGATPRALQTRYTSYYGRCTNVQAPYLADGVPALSGDLYDFGTRSPFTVDLVPAALSGRPYIVDSKGKYVGQYYPYSISYEDYNLTMLRLKPTGALVTIAVRKKGFVPLGYPYAHFFFYATPDCTGQVYFKLMYSRNLGEPFRYAYVDDKHPEAIAYAGSLKSVHILSSRSNPTCEKYDQVMNVAPLETVRIDEQGFTPPFTVKLR